MHDLKVFQNSQFGELEILTIDNKEWFPAIKVAEILGYTNPRKAIRDHAKEKGVTIRSVLSNGGMQNKKFIDEGNLYRLITRSKLPQADKFEEWVFEDVLPSIRKTGSYQVPSDPMQALKLMFKATEQTKEEIATVKADVIDLKENQKLDTGDYNLLSRTINQRVAHIQKIHAITNQKQRSELFRDINSEVKKMTGATSRTNVRQKHFDDVLSMVANWFPSQATLYKIKQLEMEFENEV
ncbi:ORF6C domain-containing protein [Staphylococcus epidermidis]|uniref:BRO family protein n=1 Tax=Staphylococcus epidermidis TaxID=1282 RepID=UPI001FB49EA1|nr:BRO family protein [Staphylococcus epidermidis]MCG1670028.1 ORF6C domain-containing protein [Staphylococcus epidermidis]MCJ1767945.1 ORF6C domain-containing protein [Staphylococcus epidermidis]